MQIPINSYVRVYRSGSSLYGKVEGHEPNGSYRVRVGGTSTTILVAAHEVGLHPTFVAMGNVPMECRQLMVPATSTDVRYHITPFVNAESFRSQQGLVPGCRAAGRFAGLDAARGATASDNVPARIKQLLDESSKGQGFTAFFDKAHADALLGAKDEFVYATRFSSTLVFYAEQIVEKSSFKPQDLVVFRFTGEGHVWYKDLEDDRADKTTTSVRLDEMEVACYGKGPEKVESEKTYLESLDWASCKSSTWYDDLSLNIRLLALKL